MSGGGGSGGADPCGGCQDPTPLCDTSNNSCVACLGHGDCSDAAAARCEGGACVACTVSAECAGVAAGDVCDGGTCVECTVDDDSACTGPETCDLTASTCTGAAALSVGNCEACTNDSQCIAGHTCIELDFQGAAHGAYCLFAAPVVNCTRPFLTSKTATSINGATATDYCSLDEDRATCEAVLALQADWHCDGGVDGMCGPPPDGAEVQVTGAVCEPIPGGDRCTYACAGVQQCPLAITSCGTGTGVPPGWCGG